MPLLLDGSVALRIGGEPQETIQINADDFAYEEGGMRVLGDECIQHEFLYVYKEPRFNLLLTTTAIDGIVQSNDLSIEAKGDVEITEEQNTIKATFDHDPDQDDEPLTPVSSN